MLLKKTGEVSPSGSGFAPTTANKVFIKHFTSYLKNRLENLSKNLITFEEINESTELFQLISLIGLYSKLLGKDVDKSLMKNIWTIQKKLCSIPIIGKTVFSTEEFLRPIMEAEKISMDPKNVQKKKLSHFDDLLKEFPFIISNMKMNIINWVLKMENEFYKDTKNIQAGDRKKYIIDTSNESAKLIILGLKLANYLRRTITYILDTHANDNLTLTLG